LLTQNDAAIQQINLSYSVEQDRLLLRVGLADNSELLVWLTNRITRQLWQLLNGEANIPTATSIQLEASPEHAVEQFKQEIQVAETLQKMDFATEYQPRKEVVNDGAMLVTSVLLESFEGKPSTLEMPCIEGMSVRMNLTRELILALSNMLQLSAKEAAWDIGVSAQSQVLTSLVTDINAKKVLH
jgi:hypothetical protein